MIFHLVSWLFHFVIKDSKDFCTKNILSVEDSDVIVVTFGWPDTRTLLFVENWTEKEVVTEVFPLLVYSPNCSIKPFN